MLLLTVVRMYDDVVVAVGASVGDIRLSERKVIRG